MGSKAGKITTSLAGAILTLHADASPAAFTPVDVLYGPPGEGPLIPCVRRISEKEDGAPTSRRHAR